MIMVDVASVWYCGREVEECFELGWFVTYLGLWLMYDDDVASIYMCLDNMVFGLAR